jgi:hypothetical protein
MAYSDIGSLISGPGAGVLFGVEGGDGALFQITVRQGVGLTYPSGTFLQNATSKNWSSFIGANALDGSNTKYFHTGWAIKLSGVTSGGVGGGDGLQPF